MTDRLALLELLADEDSPARAAALQHFADTYRSQPLAMLKWLSVQVCLSVCLFVVGVRVRAGQTCDSQHLEAA